LLTHTRLPLLATALAFGMATGSATASGFADCSKFFPGAVPKLPADTVGQLRELCFDAFAVLHSGQTKTPVFVVERLTAAQLADAKDEERTDRFYAEARLPSRERAQPDDYAGSGFDRGHMAPAGDMPTPEAMAQSFSLANMVPQAPKNNRISWSGLEKDTRKYVQRANGAVYVFSGPVFSKRARKIGDGKVWVPSYLFKLVYDQSSGRAWAHWIKNTDTAKPDKPITYRELVKRTGIEFLPTQAVKD
jgi:endonuclease G